MAAEYGNFHARGPVVYVDEATIIQYIKYNYKRFWINVWIMEHELALWFANIFRPTPNINMSLYLNDRIANHFHNDNTTLLQIFPSLALMATIFSICF